MKKTKVLSIIGALAIIATFAGCSSNSSDSSFAKSSLTSETSSQEKTRSHSDIDYNLDKEYNIGDLSFKASSSWECIYADDETIYLKINDINFYVNRSEYRSDILSDDDIFDIHMGDNYSDLVREKISDNSAVIFSIPDDYSRNIVTVYNNNDYNIYTKGSENKKNDCDKIISEVFKTIAFSGEKIAETTTIEPTITKPTEKATELQTQKSTGNNSKDDIERLLFNGNGVAIYYTGQSERESFLYDGYDKLINLRIENNSDYDYTIQGRDESINGYMITGILSCDVTSKKKANTDIIFEYKDLSKNGISEIKTVELYFSIFNFKDPSHDFKTEKIVFNP